ncbi:hypothetical protein [Streptomyces kurssanovii]|uniref:Uncharacterized protein n=1 Tax=Streptomyces kurssanovii TaxID=67312 RepID=A0ABV3I1Q3_9ACTN
MTAKACREILGDAGVGWLQDGVGKGGELTMSSTNDLEDARLSFRSQLRDWTPERKGTPYYSAPSFCTATDGFGEFSLEFGPSILPLDAPISGENEDGLIVTPVNSDVRLLLKLGAVDVSYHVFVGCKIPGTPAQQKNDVPLEGQMRDGVNGNSSARVHFTHLLHSAKVMTKAIGCENKPVIPAEPPSSVK